MEAPNLLWTLAKKQILRKRVLGVFSSKILNENF